jgi:ribokinase
MTVRVAVLGNVNADVAYDVARLPAPDETLLASGLRLGAGGKAGNASVAVARCGGHPLLIGCVGTDALGDLALAALRDGGVAVDAVRRTAAAPTGLATVLVAGGGERNAIVTHLGANEALEPGDLPDLAGCDGLLCTLGVPEPVLLAAAGRAGAAGIPLIVDATPLRRLPLPAALAGADLLSANRVEAEALTGIAADGPADAERAAAALHALGARRVVLKLGALGAMWSDGERRGHVPALPIAVVDPTGAGDAFMGALAVRWLGGEPLADAVAYACTVGAYAAAVQGAQGVWTAPAVPAGMVAGG